MTGVRRGLTGGDLWMSGVEGLDDLGPSEVWGFDGQLGEPGGD